VCERRECGESAEVRRETSASRSCPKRRERGARGSGQEKRREEKSEKYARYDSLSRAFGRDMAPAHNNISIHVAVLLV